MHLLHHVNFKVSAGVHLIEIAREYFTNTQLRVIGNMKSHFSPLNMFFYGGVLGQYNRSYWLSKASASDHHIIIMCLGRFNWAWWLSIQRVVVRLVNGRVGNFWGNVMNSFFWLWMEVSSVGVCCSGSWTLGSSAGLVTFAFLLVFAFPLHELWECQYKDKSPRRKKIISNCYYPGAVLKASSWDCDESPEKEREVSW